MALEQLVSQAEQGDLTSLDWNPDGTLLAVGSYDSILRVCSVEGGIFFSHPQHQVCINATSLVNIDSTLFREGPDFCHTFLKEWGVVIDRESRRNYMFVARQREKVTQAI